MQQCRYLKHRDCIHNTSFSSELTNGPNKLLQCYITTFLERLARQIGYEENKVFSNTTLARRSGPKLQKFYVRNLQMYVIR